MSILNGNTKLLLKCPSCLTNDWQHYKGSNGGNTRGTLWKGMIAIMKIFFFFFYFFFLPCFFKIFFFLICSEFCHTLEWNSHGFTCVPHPDLPSHLPLHPLPLGFPSAPGPSAFLMHPTWAGDLFHPRYYTCFDAVLLKHPTLSFSHRV